MDEANVRFHVSVGPHLTVQNADAIHALLVELLDKQCPIELEIDESADIDLSFVQMLIAVRRAGSFAVRKPIPHQLIQLLQRGGFLTGAESGGSEVAFLCQGE